MNTVPRYRSNPTFNSDVRNIASQLSYGLSRRTIVANLVANGRTVEQAHLLVRAAETYLKWQQNPRPSADVARQLVEAAAKYFHSDGAPAAVQQRLYRRYSSILERLRSKHPDVDLSSSSFVDDLRRRADAWWTSRAARGPGVDW